MVDFPEVEASSNADPKIRPFQADFVCSKHVISEETRFEKSVPIRLPLFWKPVLILRP